MSGRSPISRWWALLLLLPVAAMGAWLASGGLSPGESLLVPASERSAAGTAGDATGDPAAPGSDGSAPAPDTSATDSVEREPLPPLYSAWTTYDAAIEEAREKGKPVMLDFNAEWSEPCQALKHEVFDNPAATTTVEAAVIPVSIVDRVREDGENPAEAARLQRQFKVGTFPTLVVFSPTTGRVSRRQGYAGPDETLRWITEAANAVR